MIRLQIVFFFLMVYKTLAFLEPDISVPGAGQCVWYGECGQGYNQGKLNCPVTNTTKTPPKLTDKDGLRILKSYCPRLYHGDDNTYTCCSGDQLRTFESSITLPIQLLSRCPACFYNFLNSVCQITCSPEQSKFIWPNMSLPKPDPSSIGVPGIDVVVSEKYAQGLFDSCIEVQMPSARDKAMSVFCGRPAEKCSPLVWLNYMGNTGNGRAPFTIKYVVTNTTWQAPDGQKLFPLNQQNKKCNETVSGSTKVIGTEKCRCEDCVFETCPPPPKPTTDTRRQYFDSVFGKGNYRTAELIIERADSKDPVIHPYPPPSINTVKFTSIFDKNFMKQVSKLQDAVAGIRAPYQGDGSQTKTNITLDKVCTKQNGQCITESTLQVFQNNASLVDKVAWDEYHFFQMADYLDHFLSCMGGSRVTSDTTALNMSCVSLFGNTTLPYIVLQGYNETFYQNSTSFVITYVLQNTPGLHKAVVAWENAFVKFMKTYSNPNMTISFTPNQEIAQQFDEVVPLENEDDPGYSVDMPQQFDEVVAPENEDDPGYSVDMPQQFDEVVPPENEEDSGYSVVEDEEDAEQGHCVWYGQCPSSVTGWNQGALNRPASNKTRNSPLLTDPDGLRILKRYCPQLYKGDNNTRTCCDTEQLKTMEGNLALPDQLLQRCPACYSNFLNQICQMTCSPVQSQFLFADMNATCPDQFTKGPCQGCGIPAIRYIVTNEFANSLYDSCKDVQMPSANDKAMSVFCGRKAKDCSPQIWLAYMGNTGNGRAPFPISYNYSETTMVNPYTKEILHPLNYTNLRCNLTYANVSDACSCQDCQTSCAPLPPRLQDRNLSLYWESMVPRLSQRVYL